MVSFELSPAQVELQSRARGFAELELRPFGVEVDRNPDSARDAGQEMLRKMAREGYLAMYVPTAYGGAGLDALTCAVVVEELASGDAGMAFIAGLNSAPALLFGGTDEQKRKYLRARGDAPTLFGFCLTEPGAGSDAAAVKTTARRDGGGWVIDGRKCFISNAGLCAVYTVFASVDRAKGIRGITAFIVPGSTPGLSVGKVEKKMGMRTSVAADIVLEGVRVGEDDLLGEEGGGFRIAMQALGLYRVLSAGAIGVGVARAALEAAVRHCRDRVPFDKSGFESQAIGFQLADMRAAIEVARLLVWETCWLIDAGRPFGTESAMSKYFCSDVAVDVCSRAVSLVGLDSYSRDCPVEKYLRDAKLLQIYEGTNQIARMIVARQLTVS